MPVRRNDLFSVRKGRRRELIIADNYQPDDTAPFKSIPIKYPDSAEIRPISYACQNCFPYAKEMVNKDFKGLGIRNCFLVPTMNSDNIMTRIFPYYYHFWDKADLASKYKLVTSEDIKGLLFSDTFSIRDIVPGAPNNLNLLNAAQKKLYDERLIEIKDYLNDFIVKPVSVAWIRFVIRYGSVLFGTFFRFFFDSINVHKGSIELLREAQKTNLPIIYIPSNRSRLDQFILSYTLLNYDIRPPLFPISNSVLKTPILGRLAKYIGGFGCLNEKFENQNFDLHPTKEFESRCALKGIGIGIYYYVHSLIKRGNPIALSIEEGRSRSGLLSTEAFGYEYLGVLFDLLLKAEIEDAFIVPVNISYEKLPDDGILTENISYSNFNVIRKSFKSLLTYFSKDLDTVRVDFAQPFRFKEFEKHSQRYPSNTESDDWTMSKGITWTSHHASELNWNEKFGSVSSLNSSTFIMSLTVSLQAPEVPNEHSQQIRSTTLLTYHLLNDIQNCGSFMCTQLLAFLLLKKHRSGLPLDVLVDKMDELADVITCYKRDLGFRKNNCEMKNVTKRAIQLLGSSLVKITKVDKKPFVKAVINEMSLHKLNYYASHLYHLFVNDAVMCLSILQVVRNNFEEDLIENRGLNRSFKVPYRDVQIVALKLMNILQGEFLFHPPCEKDEDRVFKSLEAFRITCDISLDSATLPHRCSQLEIDESDWESDNEGNSFSNERMVVISNHETVRFLVDNAKMILPYLEMYGVMTKVLKNLLVGRVKKEIFIGDLYDEIRKYNLENNKIWGEYLSFETVRKFLVMLKKQNTIGIEYDEKSKEFYYYLLADFATEEAIVDLSLSCFDLYISI